MYESKAHLHRRGGCDRRDRREWWGVGLGAAEQLCGSRWRPWEKKIFLVDTDLRIGFAVLASFFYPSDLDCVRFNSALC